MSRRRRADKRTIPEDPRYGNSLVTVLVNMVMRRGKKSTARRIVYGAFERVSEKLGKGDSVDLLLGALENTRPKLEVPVELSYERQQSLAFRWIVEAAHSRRGVTMEEALASEIIDAYNNTGTVVKKKEDTHRMAQSNRAFAHLRW